MKEIFTTIIIWASTRENLSSGVCEQHRRRPACASEQTDQRLCYSLFWQYHILTCFERNFTILANLYTRGDWFKSRFVGNPEDRFSCAEARLLCLYLGWLADVTLGYQSSFYFSGACFIVCGIILSIIPLKWRFTNEDDKTQAEKYTNRSSPLDETNQQVQSPLMATTDL